MAIDHAVVSNTLVYLYMSSAGIVYFTEPCAVANVCAFGHIAKTHVCHRWGYSFDKHCGFVQVKVVYVNLLFQWL